MTMTSTEPRRGRRRWIYVNLALITLVALAYWVVDPLRNCRWLDRLLGISGCVASYQVTGLRALPLGYSLVVPAGGDVIVFAGREPGNARQQTTVLVILDAASGAEKLRTVVAKTDAELGAVSSADGQQMALVCYGQVPCFGDGHNAITLSPRDGKRLGAFSNPPVPLHEYRFPTDPAPPAWAAGGSVILRGGELIVGEIIGKGTIAVRQIADRSVVRTLRTADGEFKVLLTSRIALSPNGRSLAVLAAVESGSVLAVFDIASGLQTTSFASKEPLGTTVAWIGTGERLVVVRPVNSPTDNYNDSTDMRLDIYAMPKAR